MKYIVFMLFPLFLSAQSTIVPRNSDLHRLIERLEIKGSSSLHTALTDFSARNAFNETIASFDTLSVIDKHVATKLILSYPEYWEGINPGLSMGEKNYIDSSRTFYTGVEKKPKTAIQEVIEPKRTILKYFYENPAILYSVKGNDFLIKVNPILYFGLGRDVSNSSYVFDNSRGIAISGHINDKIYFYSDILESQAAFPTFVGNYINKFKAIPGNGLYKRYDSVIFGKNSGYDFLNATAYINAKVTKNIGVEFGNGKHFIGNGYRSFLLSDFSNNYLYLKFNTKFWKLNYQNIYSELIPFSVVMFPGSGIIPRKYSATHFLNFKHKNIELGIFETVVFVRDSGFDLQYLNPVILYRLVEYNLDSSDNILVGANAKYNFARRFQLYGQLLLDEFHLNELIVKREGWWANKFAVQLGIKYIDAFNVDNLDIKFESNRVRPYTYGHRTIASYSHANQSLAHPLGANLQEYIFSLSYYINPRIRLSTSNYYINQGLDTEEQYYGSDILRLSSERFQERGNNLLQGTTSTTFLSQNKLSFEISTNYFLDLNFIYRNQKTDATSLNGKNLLFSGGLRVNFWEAPVHI